MIDYLRIGHAVRYYQDLGYIIKEVPWIVDQSVDSITRPASRRAVDTRFGNLVGSAEQGFLKLMLDGSLPHDRYVATTPCFRDEGNFTKIHRLYFMKVELINTLDIDIDTVRDIAEDALNFMNRYTKCKIIEVLDPTCIGSYSLDIVARDGMELGSYGMRRHGDLKWVFGTGLAEPRLGIAMEAS